MNKVIVTKDMLMKIAEDVIDLVVKKNADYGDAWQRFGPFTSLVRLNDKLLRVETLSDGRVALVADEPISITIVDIIGYALLLLSWMKANKHQEAHQLPLFNPEFILLHLDDENDNKE